MHKITRRTAQKCMS